MTTNEFYIYEYQYPNGIPFYIGKGKGDRYKSMYKRNRYFKNIIEKIGEAIIKITFDNLHEDEAFILEKTFIKHYGRRDLGTGILVNMTDGGEGSSGIIFSDESRAKISKALKGRIFSDEHRYKMSEILKGRIISTESRIKTSKAMKGKKHSKEHRLKISESQKGKKNHNYGKKHSNETRIKMSEARKNFLMKKNLNNI